MPSAWPLAATSLVQLGLETTGAVVSLVEGGNVAIIGPVGYRPARVFLVLGVSLVSTGVPTLTT